MSTVPPITCEISESVHGERGHCVPLTRNALASLLKEMASFGQEFGGILRSVFLWKQKTSGCADWPATLI